METKEIKFQKTHLKEIGSTNTYLQESDKDRLLPEGTIVYCDIQRSGRGQRGNSWESEPYKNLTFSLLLRPEHIPANRQFLLSEIVSLATVDVLNRYATGFSIKWPNDIYWHDKKIAGILIENVLSGSTFSRAIIGMGLNINQKNFYSDAPNPVSLYQITGRTYKIEKILDEFTEAFGKRYTDTFTNSSDRIHKEYIAALYETTGYIRFIATAIFSTPLLPMSNSTVICFYRRNRERKNASLSKRFHSCFKRFKNGRITPLL